MLPAASNMMTVPEMVIPGEKEESKTIVEIRSSSE
jgi:hypothetical protein